MDEDHSERTMRLGARDSLVDAARETVAAFRRETLSSAGRMLVERALEHIAAPENAVSPHTRSQIADTLMLAASELIPVDDDRPGLRAFQAEAREVVDRYRREHGVDDGIDIVARALHIEIARTRPYAARLAAVLTAIESAERQRVADRHAAVERETELCRQLVNCKDQMRGTAPPGHELEQLLRKQKAEARDAIIGQVAKSVLRVTGKTIPRRTGWLNALIALLPKRHDDEAPC